MWLVAIIGQIVFLIMKHLKKRNMPKKQGSIVVSEIVVLGVQNVTPKSTALRLNIRRPNE
jgi:hypothetical protein